jgi:uncharacterized membrane protein YcaP (DUF421 family)
MGENEPVFFDSWASIGRMVIVGLAAYIGLVALLRVSGKRTLSKLNAFDFVVTVALGSTLATVLLSKDVPLVDGLTALALLVGLQYVVAWLNVRSEGFRRLVKNEPAVVMSRGEFHDQTMSKERVAREEVMAAVRGAGVPDISNVTVVLETDGTLSVLSQR